MCIVTVLWLALCASAQNIAPSCGDYTSCSECVLLGKDLAGKCSWCPYDKKCVSASATSSPCNLIYSDIAMCDAPNLVCARECLPHCCDTSTHDCNAETATCVPKIDACKSCIAGAGKWCPYEQQCASLIAPVACNLKLSESYMCDLPTSDCIDGCANCCPSSTSVCSGDLCLLKENVQIVTAAGAVVSTDLGQENVVQVTLPASSITPTTSDVYVSVRPYDPAKDTDPSFSVGYLGYTFGVDLYGAATDSLVLPVSVTVNANLPICDSTKIYPKYYIPILAIWQDASATCTPPLPVLTVNTGDKCQITFSVCHFTQFALFGEASGNSSSIAPSSSSPSPSSASNHTVISSSVVSSSVNATTNSTVSPSKSSASASPSSSLPSSQPSSNPSISVSKSSSEPSSIEPSSSSAAPSLRITSLVVIVVLVALLL